MQVWINTQITLTTAITNEINNQQILPDCRKLSTADINTLITILTPLLASPIKALTTTTTTEFVS